MKTRVRIIPKMELHALGLNHSRSMQERIAAKTAASELSGELIDEIYQMKDGTIYALPPHRRREKCGFRMLVTQVSKRYLYAET